MGDGQERTLERRIVAAGGDPYAAGALQIIRCRRGDHTWVQGDKLATSCGCPIDPGIHRCHPEVCSFCEISSEDDPEY